MSEEPTPITKAVRVFLDQCPDCGSHIDNPRDVYPCTHCAAKRIAQQVLDEAKRKSGSKEIKYASNEAAKEAGSHVIEQFGPVFERLAESEKEAP
jgi:hypothetical protein